MVRVDGSPVIGLGHVMRCIAFAEAAADRGIHAQFVVTQEATTTAILSRRGFDLVTVDGPDDHQWMTGLRPGDVVLIDGYHFPRSLLEAAATSGAPIAVMDDLTVGDLGCVVVIPEREPNEIPPGTRGTVLAGVRYTPIRREFRRYRRLRGEVAGDATLPLLVVMGGADPTGLTTLVVDTVGRCGLGAFTRLDVLIGPAAADPLAELPSALPGRLMRDPPDIASVFDASGAAVSAAGGTALELMCMGVPGAFVEVNESQTAIGAAIEREGTGIRLGGGPGAVSSVPRAITALGEAALRRQLSEAALEWVDGHGAARAIDVLATL
jgi:spore coat polysaccharide biosynthesis predicted glycosyltransferase SpsG